MYLYMSGIANIYIAATVIPISLFLCYKPYYMTKITFLHLQGNQMPSNGHRRTMWRHTYKVLANASVHINDMFGNITLQNAIISIHHITHNIHFPKYKERSTLLCILHVINCSRNKCFVKNPHSHISAKRNKDSHLHVSHYYYYFHC